MTKTSSPTEAVCGQDRQWFIENFGSASQLESKIIPDILGKAPCRPGRTFFPVTIPQDSLEALRKRLPYPEDIVLGTAFGITLSVWSADTKACFAFSWEEIGRAHV